MQPLSIISQGHKKTCASEGLEYFFVFSYGKSVTLAMVGNEGGKMVGDEGGKSEEMTPMKADNPLHLLSEQVSILVAEVDESSVSTSSTKSRRIRKSCSIDGCTTAANKGGLCTRHGGVDKCKHDGCFKNAVKKGLCVAHGYV
jgi:hypothetical protein